MYRIGEFSKLSKTTIKTLRYYDEIGLLKPEQIDKFTNHRFYTTVQLVHLHKIQSLRQAGMSIDEIKLILTGHNVNGILEKRKAELLDALEDTKDQLKRIDFILQGKEDESFLSYSAALKELPQCIVYSKKMLIPNFNSYFQMIGEIDREVSERYPNLKRTSPECCFTVYLDGEYREKDFNVEYCEAVEEQKPDFDGIVFKKTDAHTALSVMHKGTYEGLHKAYAYAFKWIEENGYIASDAPRECYIDGIWNREDEDKWLTELQIPIVKK